MTLPYVFYSNIIPLVGDVIDTSTGFSIPAGVYGHGHIYYYFLYASGPTQRIGGGVSLTISGHGESVTSWNLGDIVGPDYIYDWGSLPFTNSSHLDGGGDILVSIPGGVTPIHGLFGFVGVSYGDTDPRTGVGNITSAGRALNVPDVNGSQGLLDELYIPDGTAFFFFDKPFAPRNPQFTVGFNAYAAPLEQLATWANTPDWIDVTSGSADFSGLVGPNSSFMNMTIGFWLPGSTAYDTNGMPTLTQVPKPRVMFPQPLLALATQPNAFYIIG